MRMLICIMCNRAFRRWIAGCRFHDLVQILNIVPILSTFSRPAPALPLFCCPFHGHRSTTDTTTQTACGFRTTINLRRSHLAIRVDANAPSHRYLPAVRLHLFIHAYSAFQPLLFLRCCVLAMLFERFIIIHSSNVTGSYLILLRVFICGNMLVSTPETVSALVGSRKFIGSWIKMHEWLKSRAHQRFRCAHVYRAHATR